MKKKLQMGIFLILLSMMFVLPVYAGETDGWLDGWDYEIQDDGETVYLTGYNGSSGDLDIYGKVRIDGETYNTVIYYDRKNDKSAFTGNSGIRSITFHAVDGRKVKGSDQYSMWGFFANMTNLESISFGNGFDSSEIQDMKHMFDGDTSLEDIDFENLDVGSCGVFSYSFQKCSSLRDIDVYVPYAYGYSGMFKGCSSLETARIQGERDGGSFTSINYMFEGCSNLKSVELIDVKTGGEGEFKQVFKGCTSLEDIDLSELDFSLATNLTNMFQMCTSLTDIDLSSVDFSNVTDMSGMFAGCKSLESLDLSGHTWVSGGPRMDQIISSCPNLTEIIIDKNIQVSSATSFLGAENDYVKTKVIGQMSDSFKKNAMSKLLIGNRYIAAADVKASINLVRDGGYVRIARRRGRYEEIIDSC